MYFIDSANPVIAAYDYDQTDGSISNKRSAFNMTQHGLEVSYADLRLILDGLNVDSEGNLYAAYAGTGQVQLIVTRSEGPLLIVAYRSWSSVQRKTTAKAESYAQ